VPDAASLCGACVSHGCWTELRCLGMLLLKSLTGRPRLVVTSATFGRLKTTQSATGDRGLSAQPAAPGRARQPLQAMHGAHGVCAPEGQGARHRAHR